MRWLARFLVVLVVLAIGYAAWPFRAAYDFVAAVRSRDAAAIAQRVNFPAVRFALTQQIVIAYLQLSGKEPRLGPFGREIAVAAVASVADPIVARLVSPEALVEFLEKGPAGAGASTGNVMQGLGSGSVDTAWRLLTHSQWGFRRFALSLPVDAPPPRRFKLRFRLTNWTWKLSAVDLPEELRARLVQELVRQTERK